MDTGAATATMETSAAVSAGTMSENIVQVDQKSPEPRRSQRPRQKPCTWKTANTAAVAPSSLTKTTAPPPDVMATPAPTQSTSGSTPQVPLVTTSVTDTRGRKRGRPKKVPDPPSAAPAPASSEDRSAIPATSLSHSQTAPILDDIAQATRLTKSVTDTRGRKRGRPKKVPDPPSPAPASSEDLSTVPAPSLDDFAQVPLVTTSVTDNRGRKRGRPKKVLDPPSAEPAPTSTEDLSTVPTTSPSVTAPSLGDTAQDDVGATPSKLKKSAPSQTNKNKRKSTHRQRKKPAGNPQYQKLTLAHKCKSCDEIFDSYQVLRKHAKIHKTEKTFGCAVCGKRYRTKIGMKDHEWQHSGEKLMCDLCGKHFVSVSGFRSHKTRMHSGVAFQCPVCKKLFRTTAERRMHQKVVHQGLLEYTCETCGQQFGYASNLVEHRRKHRGERPYKCVHCGKGFFTTQMMKAHVRIHTGEKPFACEKCGQRFMISIHLKEHMNTHTGVRQECPYCEKTFVRRGHLRRHIKQAHEGLPLPKVNWHTEKTPVATSLPAETEVSMATNYVVAMKEASEGAEIDAGEIFFEMETEQVVKTDPVTPEPSQPHINKAELREIITGPGPDRKRKKPTVCKICRKTFKYNSDLQRHLVTHTGIKRCVCRVCGKSFKGAAGLRYHMWSHRNVTLECEACNKSYRSKASFKKHLLFHHGITFCDMESALQTEIRDLVISEDLSEPSLNMDVAQNNESSAAEGNSVTELHALPDAIPYINITPQEIHHQNVPTVNEEDDNIDELPTEAENNFCSQKQYINIVTQSGNTIITDLGVTMATDSNVTMVSDIVIPIPAEYVMNMDSVVTIPAESPVTMGSDTIALLPMDYAAPSVDLSVISDTAVMTSATLAKIEAIEAIEEVVPDIVQDEEPVSPEQPQTATEDLTDDVKSEAPAASEQPERATEDLTDDVKNEAPVTLEQSEPGTEDLTDAFKKDESEGRPTPTRTRRTEPKPLLRCEVCCKTFRYTCDLKRHSITHTRARPCVCTVCGKAFSCTAGLKYHMWSHSGIILQCSECRKTFKSKDCFRQHMLLQHGKTCDMEELLKQIGAASLPAPDTSDDPAATISNNLSPTSMATTGTANDTASETAAETDAGEEAARTCGEGGQVFQLSSQLRELGHKKEKLFVCKVCGKNTSSRTDLSSHMKTHKGEGDFKVNINVPQKVVTPEAVPLTNLIKSSALKLKALQKFTCGKCGERFRYKKDLRYHSQLHDKPVLYGCSVCEKSYRTKIQLREHEWKHTGEKLVCDLCGKHFTSYGGFRSHKTRIHSGKYFPCKLCGKKLCTEPELRTHEKVVHEGLREYTCETCGQQFRYPSNLLEHRRKHTGERPFKCQYCGKGFTMTCMLKAHLRVHTGDRPYGCEFCGKKFTIAIGLKEHRYIHTGERPHQCNLCEKNFYKQSHLSRHVNSHHNDNKVRPPKKNRQKAAVVVPEAHVPVATQDLILQQEAIMGMEPELLVREEEGNLAQEIQLVQEQVPDLAADAETITIVTTQDMVAYENMETHPEILAGQSQLTYILCIAADAQSPLPLTSSEIC